MGGGRLHGWLAEQAPELVALVVDELARRVPFYALQPREVLDGPVRMAVEANLRIVLETLGQGREPNVEERAEVITWSARRAEQGVPLEAVLTAYHLAVEVWWRAAAEQAPPEEAAAVHDLGLHLLAHLRSVVPAVTLAHVQEQQQLYGERREARRALLSALLSGEPARPLAARAGTALAPSYTVVALHLGGPSSRHRLGGILGARRVSRNLEATLAAHAGGHVLASFDGSGGTVLLPGTAVPDLPELAGRLGDAVEREARAAVTTASGHAEIPGAAAEAREVLGLVVRLKRPPGLYRLEDVLLEYQLARPGSGLAKLAARLDPIADRPDLMDTVRAVAARGHNRRRASLDLHVHRNTLDYRLRRIAELTGLDPADPDGFRLLTAALTARDLLH
ncbi:helix-turn-helix domain-containing protein [Actinocorallia sp. API 0066]|uniref:PucR family transcriptional regulator n=1 Tax=Actinocorallia sp. API 0066 TaxID=2896846 RepID=UPI001E3D1FD8|nr:helix-turn-helix domain-containing protein [Actinocorallia sp. API 0066]MCD0449163.1 helix-turn-helix domain-containing protein [Actinocorallia sp. API 0066]